MIYLILILSIVLSTELQGQVLTGSTGEIKFYARESKKLLNENKQNVVVSVLPFALYSEIFGAAAGGFVAVRGLSQKNMSLYAGGLISTNGTKYGFVQLREFYLPFFPRIYIAPDLLGGYFGVLNIYKDPPSGLSEEDPTKRAGSNESDKNDFIEVSGYDQWFELKFRYLLPLGHGKDNIYFEPNLENGILKSGEMGGTNWNPLISGRTFIDIKPFYRKRVAFATNGLEFAIVRENTDYYVNPTRGSLQKIAFRRDFGWFDSMTPWSVLETDLRWYIPLNEIIGSESSVEKVLALDFWTVNTLTWNNYDSEGITDDGTLIKNYHRPPPYTGAYLGGRYRLRAFYEGRFNDKSAIYYGAEYRQIIDWNPFNYWSLSRKLNIHWLQIAVFGELGRVAPEWNISTLHRDMKWSTGVGFRIFMNNLILRLDGALGKEGFYMQMFVDHAF